MQLSTSSSACHGGYVCPSGFGCNKKAGTCECLAYSSADLCKCPAVYSNELTGVSALCVVGDDGFCVNSEDSDQRCTASLQPLSPAAAPNPDLCPPGKEWKDGECVCVPLSPNPDCKPKPPPTTTKTSTTSTPTKTTSTYTPPAYTPPPPPPAAGGGSGGGSGPTYPVRVCGQFKHSVPCENNYKVSYQVLDGKKKVSSGKATVCVF